MDREGGAAAGVEMERLVQATLLGDAVESSVHAIFVAEEYGGRQLAVNQAACRLLGYDRTTLLGMTVGQISGRSPEELASVFDELVRGGSVAGTTRLRRSDGTVVEIEYCGSRTSIAGIHFLLAITAAVDTARVVG